jgi:hypothetical protein
MSDYITLEAPKWVFNKITNWINYNYNDLTPINKETLINRLYHLWMRVEMSGKGDWVNIKQTELDCFFIKIKNKKHKYTFLRDILVEMDLLRINHKYSADKTKTKRGKAFSKSYITTKPTTFELIDFNFNINLITTNKTKDYWLKLYTNHSEQIELIYLLDVDIKAADKHLDHLISIGYKNKKGEPLTLEKKYIHINHLKLIKNKLLYFSIDKQSGRFFSSITGLFSELRQFITLNGENLIELDIKNAAPLMLSHFINNDKYKKDVEDGIFYDKLTTKLYGVEPNTPDWKQYRHKTKERLFRTIFFNNKELKSGDLYKHIKLEYNDLIDEINNIKQQELLWLKLQKLEVDIILDKLSRLNNNYISIHDAILIPPTFKHEFLLNLKQLFKEYNLKVSISIN